MRKFSISTIISIVAVIVLATSAFAAVTFDPATGTGFVGKGDVQYTLGWNNQQLQTNVNNVQFQTIGTSVTTTTWTCDRDGGPQTQERNNATTTSTTSVLSSVGRLKTQITGFNLNGFGSTTSTTESDGPAVGSCPTGWTAIDLTTNTVTGATTIKVSGDGGANWTPLLEKPI